MLSYKKVISLNISTGSRQDFINEIILLAKSKSSYVCFTNVHMTVEAYDDVDFAKCVNNADIVSPDGMPLTKCIKLLYNTKQDRIAATDIIPDILKNAEQNHLTVYFYGGTPEMQKHTKNFIEKKYPNLVCTGYDSPPFRVLNEEEKSETINRINKSGAKLLFVILGCPKQEKWMAYHKDKINACMLGIGGALPILIGIQKRAPIWMQKMSLEWLYRLIQEPRRLFKRYFYTNFKFIYLIIKIKIFTKKI
ncbi:MAG: WecB/TagA/CpsF family glycosyltransferase [Flavobacteriia bacterium]|nr:WecB/TagA/CpsF family glycosyltransferase [Flavobacteriia bacterium]